MPRNRTNPYLNLPADRFWRTGVAEADPGNLTGIHVPKWAITRDDTMATMGSCFAQHIGKWLRANGFRVPFLDSAENVRSQVFSANYGNVYTARQALQLVREAQGRHRPSEIAWQTDGGYLDAFRPAVFETPFADPAAVAAARAQHLTQVAQVFRDLDVFVFTLGLTEAWTVRACGSVLATAPGVLGGAPDESRYEFRNFGFEEVLADLRALAEEISGLRDGRAFRLLLTVSPVPLTATGETRHVLQSSVYSKAVLRAVAGQFTAETEFADYFPSFEIVTNPKSLAGNFAANLRSVEPDAVATVMAHFERAYVTGDNRAASPNPAGPLRRLLAGADEVDCEEALLEQFAGQPAAPAPPPPTDDAARILIFGDSQLGFFRNAMTDETVLRHARFAQANFLTNDPFAELETHRFRRFRFRIDQFPDCDVPRAKTLVIVGFRLFGDGILRALDAVKSGRNDSDPRAVRVSIPLLDEVTLDQRHAMRMQIRGRLETMRRVWKHGGFGRMIWVVSPDFPESCARLRYGDAFVDSGMYRMFKAAYREEFDAMRRLVGLKAEFMFNEASETLAPSGFALSRYQGRRARDIHPIAEFHADTARRLERRLLRHLAAS